MMDKRGDDATGWSRRWTILAHLHTSMVLGMTRCHDDMIWRQLESPHSGESHTAVTPKYLRCGLETAGVVTHHGVPSRAA